MLREPAPVPQVLTPEQEHRRRQRSIALASCLGGIALLFFVVTVAKLVTLP